MKVKAVKSFSYDFDGEIGHIPEGKEFDLPEGVDWLHAGLVVPVREEKIETATRKPQEKAVTRSPAASAGRSKRKPTRKKKTE